MTETDIVRLIDPILRGHLLSSGLETVDVRTGEDHEGTPSLFVHLYFEGRGRSVDTPALIAGMAEARDALDAAGELRVPYMKLHIPDLDRDIAA